MRSPVFLMLALLAGTTASAQSVMYTSATRVFHSTVGQRTVVRDQAGNLYAAYADLFVPSQSDVAIARSTDGGQTWNMKWQTGFAANASTDWGNRAPSLAIDSQDNLHCSWYHGLTSSASSRSVRYNRWDARTQAWGTEWDVTGNGYKFNVHALAVDAQDHVWFIHSKTGTSWRCDVERSNLPFASDLKFTVVSPAFSTQATCQNVSLMLDALGRAHVTYYSNQIPGASIYHRVFDGTQWSPETILGNANSTADEYSCLAGDAQGNAYVFYGLDTQSGKTQDPAWELRKWDGTTQQWSAAVPVYKTTRAQYKPGGTDNNGRVITCACDETTGELYFVYRNYETGELLLGRSHDGDATPTIYARLTNTGSLPANSLNYFLDPQLRGTVSPSFNRTGAGLDILFAEGDQTASTRKYTLDYDRFPVGSLDSTATPRIGTTFPLDLTAVLDPGRGYVTALSTTDIQPGIPVGRRFIPLTPDSMFFITAQNMLPVVFQNFTGVLGASGTAHARIVIPNLPVLVSLKLYAAFVTYPGATGVHTISNPFTFTIMP